MMRPAPRDRHQSILGGAGAGRGASRYFFLIGLCPALPGHLHQPAQRRAGPVVVVIVVIMVVIVMFGHCVTP